MVSRGQVAGSAKEFAQVCHRQGVKATPQRMEIMRELAASGEHPDAETIHEGVRRRLPNISLDTVYRTLKLLEQKGVIDRVGVFRDRARFEFRARRHHHFVCKSCGLIGDIHGEDLDRFASPSAVRALGRVEEVYVELRGFCRECAKRKGK